MVNGNLKVQRVKKKKYLAIAIIIGIFLLPICYFLIGEYYHHWKWMKRMTNSHLVVVGVDTSTVKKLLGEPDDRVRDGWLYIEETFTGPGEVFDITFKEGIVYSTSRYNF